MVPAGWSDEESGCPAEAKPSAARTKLTRRMTRRIPASFHQERLGQNAVPAFAVRTPDELIGFRRIPGAQVDGVPLELLPGPVGHVAQVVRLGDPTGIQEVRTGRRPLALARLDPFNVVAGRTRQCLRRRRGILEVLLGQ